MARRTVYEKAGYVDRNEYLTVLADEYGFRVEYVKEVAERLGKAEDFSGLLLALQDVEDANFDAKIAPLTRKDLREGKQLIITKEV